MIAGQIGYVDVLRNREYRKLWIGQGLSQFGDNISLIAVPLIVFNLTGSSSQLALSFVFGILPSIILAPFGGILSDLVRRKNIILAADAVRMLCVLGIFFARESWQIYALQFLAEAMTALFLPAFSALIPVLVGRGQLVKTISLSHSTYVIMKVVGPAVAATAIPLVSHPRHLLWFDIASFVFALLAVSLIREPSRAGPKKQSMRGAVREYGRLIQSFYSRWNDVTLKILALSLFTALSSGVGFTLVLLAKHLSETNVTPDQLFGWMSLTTSVGVVLGAGYAGRTSSPGKDGPNFFTSFLLYGVGIAVVGLFGHWQPTLIALFVSGFFSSMVQVCLSSSFAAALDPDSRGRIYSSINAIAGAGALCGYYAVGLISGFVEPSSLFVIIGGTAVACAGVLALFRIRPNAVPTEVRIEEPSF